MNLNQADFFPAEALAGQRMMIGFDGLTCESKLQERIKKNRPAGIIFFRNNIQSRNQMLDLIGELRTRAQAEGLPGLLLAIDQEGGPVARLKAPHFRELPGIAELENENAATEHATMMAQELRSLGIHMNMAPVLDISHGCVKSIMLSRTFRGDAEQVARMGLAMIRAYRAQGIASVGKHFPGIGHTTLDSHHELPSLDAEINRLESRELIPFRAAIDAGVPGIMLSHILYDKLDNKWPASLSRIIAKDLLRNKLGFQGVSMTDDLDMKAIGIPMPVVAERIVDADMDLALICHEGPAIDDFFRRLKELAGDPVQREGFVRSAKRVLKLKQTFSATLP